MSAIGRLGDERGVIQAKIVYWILAGVAVTLAAILIWALNLDGAPPDTVTEFYTSQVQTGPPAALNSAAPVAYKVIFRRETRPSGAGAAFPPKTVVDKPAAGLSVTFVLGNGFAVFADGTTKTVVKTDANGLATVSVVPKTSGADNLTFQITFKHPVTGRMTTETDTDVAVFEVQAP